MSYPPFQFTVQISIWQVETMVGEGMLLNPYNWLYLLIFNSAISNI